MNKSVYVLLGLVLAVLAAGMVLLNRIDDSVETPPQTAGADADLATEADAAKRTPPKRSLSAPPVVPRVEADPSLSRGFGTKKPAAAAADSAAVDAEGNPVPQTYSLFSHAMAPIALNFDKGPFQRRSDGRILKTDTATRADGLNQEDSTAEEDIEVIGSIIDHYRRIFGANPIAGENRDVVLALTGDNPHRLALIDPSSPAISGGELVDRWGTPFRFHPVDSRLPMEIFSAGPDTEFATPDDITYGDPADLGIEQFEQNF